LAVATSRMSSFLTKFFGFIFPIYVFRLQLFPPVATESLVWRPWDMAISDILSVCMAVAAAFPDDFFHLCLSSVPIPADHVLDCGAFWGSCLRRQSLRRHADSATLAAETSYVSGSAAVTFSRRVIWIPIIEIKSGILSRCSTPNNRPFRDHLVQHGARKFWTSMWRSKEVAVFENFWVQGSNIFPSDLVYKTVSRTLFNRVADDEKLPSPLRSNRSPDVEYSVSQVTLVSVGRTAS